MPGVLVDGMPFSLDLSYDPSPYEEQQQQQQLWISAVAAAAAAAVSAPPPSSPTPSSSPKDLLLEALHRFLPSNVSAAGGSGGAAGHEDSGADVYSCDEFRMFEFKVRRCMRGRSHDWTECPFAHPGEKARRRDPRRFHYSGAACPDFRKGSCKNGDACELAHGVFECWLHPARYRTQPCKDGQSCKRRVCFFAHTPDQLRVLNTSSSPSPPCSKKASCSDCSCLHVSAKPSSAATAKSFAGSAKGSSFAGNGGGAANASFGSGAAKPAFLSSPTSTLMSHMAATLSPPLSPAELSPAEVSPPLSPQMRMQRRFSSASTAAPKAADLVSALHQLELSRYGSPPYSPPAYGSSYGSAYSTPATAYSSGPSPLRPNASRSLSMPCTPTKQPAPGWMWEMDEEDDDVAAAPPSPRVGRQLRARIYGGLAGRSDLTVTSCAEMESEEEAEEEAAAEPSPDLNWVTDLLIAE